MRWIILALMTATSACASAGPQRTTADLKTAVIFGTVGHSEWCPAGNVRVDLVTGRYELTPRAPRAVCLDTDLERRSFEGRLEGSRLRALQQASEHALADGFDKCRAGMRSDEIVVSNGGVPVLVVTDGRGTASAPSDLNCWTDAL